jgi:hypothetical protein
MSVPHNFRYFKTSPEITCLFVMMCLHYPLSLQTIEACSTRAFFELNESKGIPILSRV